MTEQLALETDDARLGRVVGVTTVLGYTQWPGDDALRRAWKLGRRNVLLTDAQAYEQRTRGLDVHRAAEQLARGESVSVQEYPVTSRGFIESLVAWWRVRRPRVLASEVSLQNPAPELRIRGRIDLVLECDRPDCPVCGSPMPGVRRGVILLDYKTGTVSDAKSRLQVGGGYRLLWEGARDLPAEMRDRPLCAGELVLVDRDGGQAVSSPVSDRVEGFLHALALYRDMERAGDLPEKTL